MAKSKRGPWSVYMHIVPKEISGYDHDKYYIGITSQKPEYRWLNGNGYKEQFFFRAINKYGWDNIQHKVVATHMLKEDAEDFERLLIFLYNSTNSQHGYNLTYGGEGGPLSEIKQETKDKLSVSSKKNWQNEEYIQKVKDGLPRGKDHFNSVSVVLLNTGEVFECESDAARKYGVPTGIAMANYCNGISNCEKKDENGNCLVWAWYEDYLNITEEEIQNKIELANISINRKPLVKKIVCLNTGVVYDYAYKIMHEYGLNNLDRVLECCRFISKSSGASPTGERLVWRYLEDYELMDEDEINNIVNEANKKICNKHHAFKILDKLTNTVYPSMKACERATNISRAYIKKAVSDIEYYAQKSVYKDRFERVY